MTRREVVVDVFTQGNAILTPPLDHRPGALNDDIWIEIVEFVRTAGGAVRPHVPHKGRLVVRKMDIRGNRHEPDFQSFPKIADFETIFTGSTRFGPGRQRSTKTANNS